MTLPERVLQTVRMHGLIAPGGRVLVALSGGPDSVTLLHVLRALESVGEFHVVGVGHYNHQLRGGAADLDEQFCRALADTLRIPFEAGRGDVRAMARAARRSVEDAARTVRYQFLEEAADRLRADVIAVGHSLDDQAETFLLRLIRGAGPRGLAGIRPRAGRVVRPLLDVRRADIRAYAAEYRLAFREDATNDDCSVPRNRVRHGLLPYLEREFSPGIVEVLAREAAIAREDEDRLQREAIDLAASIVLTSNSVDNPRIEVDVVALRSLHPALASRVAREALSRLARGRFIGAEHIARFLELAAGTRDASVSMPGQDVARHGDRIVLKRPAGPAFANFFQVPLSIPGEVMLSAQGWAVSADWDAAPGPAGAGMVQPRSPLSVPVQAAALPLAVRSRRRGDRFRPLGLGGRGKKLQDFLVDRKVARELRDALPLVVDRDDRIVWVVGEAVAEDFRVTEPAQGVILLKARRLGGVG
jgi:tRNA(Ile)-lysidine synthase